MNAARILKRVSELRLPVGDYALHTTAALVLMGILERAGDIDLLARGGAWERAKQLGRLTRGVEDDLVKVGEDVEVWGGWFGSDVGPLIDAAVSVRGVPCVQLSEIVRVKERMGRPKDEEHLLLIRAYLAERNG